MTGLIRGKLHPKANFNDVTNYVKTQRNRHFPVKNSLYKHPINKGKFGH